MELLLECNRKNRILAYQNMKKLKELKNLKKNKKKY